jgi:hypothetical protein
MKRRSTLIGLGSLAIGSGATLSAAAFSNSVNPSSDMRVVVEEQLIVEPGIMFRDGSDPDDPFDPDSATTGTNVYDNDGFSGSGDEIFGGNGDPGLEDIGFGDVQAASANDAVNDNLKLEVALPFEEDKWLGNGSEGFLQIRNDTTEDQEVAIRFETFGADTNGDQDQRGGAVSESDVVDILSFREGKTGNKNKISSIDVGTGSSPPIDDQTVANTVTVGTGDIEQVFLDYDTTIASSDIETAAGVGNPFADGTADLVDALRVGTDPTNTQ